MYKNAGIQTTLEPIDFHFIEPKHTAVILRVSKWWRYFHCWMKHYFLISNGTCCIKKWRVPRTFLKRNSKSNFLRLKLATPAAVCNIDWSIGFLQLSLFFCYVCFLLLKKATFTVISSCNCFQFVHSWGKRHLSLSFNQTGLLLIMAWDLLYWSTSDPWHHCVLLLQHIRMLMLLLLFFSRAELIIEDLGNIQSQNH